MNKSRDSVRNNQREAPGNIQNGGRRPEVTDQTNESKLGNGMWGCDWKSEIGDVRKSGVVRARDPLEKPMLRGGAHPTHPYRSRRTIREMGLLTKYRSEETLTRMRSSPTRTFSPSDLCLEAGCIVHQQASPMSGLTVRTMVPHNALPHGSHS